jgi:hypothetical protein
MTAASRTTIALFVAFQALYALTSSGNAFRIPDEFEVYFQVEHLVDAGDISVPQTLQIQQPVIVDGKVVGTQSLFFGKVGQDGKPYAPYGPLAALVALPHHLAGRAIASLLGVPRLPQSQGLAWVILVGGLTMLTTATAAALAVAGFYRAAIALGTPSGSALTLSLLLGGATVLWPYGTSFYTEAWQAATLIWAAALLLEARTANTGAMGRVIGAAALLTVTGLTKVTSLVFVPGFVVAVLLDRSIGARQRMQSAVVLGAGIAVAVAGHLAWNVYRFGSPFDFGYNWAETIPVLPPQTFRVAEVPRGLAVLLASRGKSLFLWAPVLVLAALSAVRFHRREPAVAMGLATTFTVGLVFYAAYLFPEGGYSHGPRHLVPIVPLLLLAAAGAEAGRWPRAAIVACATLGATLAILATAVSFLEDQAMSGDPRAPQRAGYYERIDPAPGRAINRYRLEYIPFLTTITTPGWASAPVLGQGPDYFPLHLQQARRQLRDGQRIPAWFAWVWPAMWIGVLAAALRWLISTNAPLPAKV